MKAKLVLGPTIFNYRALILNIVGELFWLRSLTFDNTKIIEFYYLHDRLGLFCFSLVLFNKTIKYDY
jgi:hypothetical protein